MVCRSDSLANKLTNKQNYLRMHKELCALNSVKSSFEGTIYLQVSDLIIDEDAKKFHSLIDASKALNVVRDPISVLKAVVCCPHRISDAFVDEQCFFTMREIAQHFGLNEPKEEQKELFSKRVSDLKYFTPINIYANDEIALFDEENKKEIDINVLKNSITLVLTDRFKMTDFWQDLSEFFEIDSAFSVYLKDQNDAIKLFKGNLLRKLKIYLKALSQAILEQAKIENAKKFSENDVLNYFKIHKKQRQFMKWIMTQHLSVLKAHKPDIVASFTHLASFDELCKDDEPLDLSADLGAKFSVTNY